MVATVSAGFNCGSSSVKIRLYKMRGDSEENLKQDEIGYFLAERVDKDLTDEANITYRRGNKEYKIRRKLKNHRDAFKVFLELSTKYKSIKKAEDIKVGGHRVVMGGRDIIKPMEANEGALELIAKNKKYAPLHNGANQSGIEVSTKILPGLESQFIFCDTEFHKTIPDKARLYFLPYDYFEGGYMAYGFHGTSHRVASEEGPKIVGLDGRYINQLTLHLGNGSSICAVLNGKSVDNTMGLTPLEGLPMGTRSGDLDPSLVKYIYEREGFTTIDEVVDFLNKECGLKGVTGYSDMREIIDKAADGDERCILAREAYAYRVAKAAYSLLTPFNGKLDLLVWTGGIGENDHETRRRVCHYMSGLGLELNEDANNQNKQIITTPDSKIKSVIVPANEEAYYAKHAYLMHLDKAA